MFSSSSQDSFDSQTRKEAAIREKEPPTFGSGRENGCAHSYVALEDIRETFLPEKTRGDKLQERHFDPAVFLEFRKLLLLMLEQYHKENQSKDEKKFNSKTVKNLAQDQ